MKDLYGNAIHKWLVINQKSKKMKKAMYWIVAGVLFVASTKQSMAQKANNGFEFSVKSDLVRIISADCVEINVRVISRQLDNGQELLVVTQNVYVGTCPAKMDQSHKNCPDIPFKGDFIIGNAESFNNRCLVDYLKDESIYADYLMSKYKTLAQLKKKR